MKRTLSILFLVLMAAALFVLFDRFPATRTDTDVSPEASTPATAIPTEERTPVLRNTEKPGTAAPGEEGPPAPDTFLLADGVVLASGGLPAEGAIVSATLLDSDGVASAETLADSSGAFRLVMPTSAFRAGPRDVALSAHLEDRVSLPFVAAGGPTVPARSVLLRLRDGATVSGRAVDHGGAPVPGAVVYAMAFPAARDPWENPATDGLRLSVRADEAGGFRLQLPPSHVRVFARDTDGVFSHAIRIDVAAGEFADLGDVTVGGPGVVLTLRVTGPDRAPIAGSSIRMDVDEAVQRHIGGGGTQLAHATTNDEGIAVVRVRADSVPVRFAVGDRSHAVVEVVAERLAGSDRMLDIVLVARPTVFVRLVDAQDRPIPTDVEAFVTLSPENAAPDYAPRRLAFGVPVDVEVSQLSQVSEAESLDRAIVGTGIERCADDSGFIAIARTVGRHRVSVQLPGGHAFTSDVELTDERRTAEVVCRMPPGRWVAVDVVRHGPAPDDFTDWNVWPSVAGGLDAEWPREPDEWTESRARGTRVELMESVPGEWTGRVQVFATLEQNELVARDVEAAMRRGLRGGRGPHSSEETWRPSVEPLLRRTIPSGDAPGVTFDLGTVAPEEPTTQLVVRLSAGEHPVRIRGWTVNLRRGQDSAVRHGVTGDDGVARFSVPTGRWRIELSSDVAPPDPVWVEIVDETPASVEFDLSKLRWN